MALQNNANEDFVMSNTSPGANGAGSPSLATYTKNASSKCKANSKGLCRHQLSWVMPARSCTHSAGWLGTNEYGGHTSYMSATGSKVKADNLLTIRKGDTGQCSCSMYFWYFVLQYWGEFYCTWTLSNAGQVKVQSQ